MNDIPDDSKQQPDPRPGPYYVSMQRDESKTGFRLLSGPYPEHQIALDLVEKARNIAQGVDVKAVWYSFGTCRCEPPEFNEQGLLQQLGYNLDLEKSLIVLQ